MKDATPHSNSYGFCAISGAQFFHNVLDMTLDCIFRNRQQTSDFTVSVSSGNFLQDLYLALAERFLAQVLRQACCNFRWNMLSSAVNLADCLDELLARHALEHVSLGAGLQRAMNLGVAFKRGEHDHPSAWKVRADRHHRVNATDVGQTEIHQRDIRAMRAKALDCLATVRCFGYQNHVLFISDNCRDAFAHQRMIVYT